MKNILVSFKNYPPTRDCSGDLFGGLEGDCGKLKRDRGGEERKEKKRKEQEKKVRSK